MEDFSLRKISQTEEILQNFFVMKVEGSVNDRT